MVHVTKLASLKVKSFKFGLVMCLKHQVDSDCTKFVKTMKLKHANSHFVLTCLGNVFGGH
jgi:hypothetical protein